MTPPRPLAGVKILDASHLAAGPWCTMVLADLGADVVKVERPGSGDIARTAGTVYVGDQSAVFLAFNRNKRSVALDLTTEDGREVFYRLIQDADVFVQNFRPGTAEKLGIGYEDLRKRNPGLVYVSISAFGPSGPYADRPANDPIIQGMSGAMALTGEGDRPPARQGVGVPDFGTGMMAATGIVAALLGRLTSGAGQHLEYNLLDVEIFALGPRGQEFLINGDEQPRLGSAHPQFSPYQAFACAGGQYLYLAIINDKFWQAFCRAVQRPEWAEDPAYRTNRDRCARRDELAGLIEPVMAGASRDTWIEVFAEHGVPCGPVNSLQEAFDDPQVRHNGTVTHFTHPTAGDVATLALPFRLSGEQTEIRTPPPLLGQHTRDVLVEYGLDDSRVDDLLEQGVVAQADL